MDKEIYEDLFKNVVINGHYPFEKLNEIKSYIKTLNIKIENLEQQCQKQKEVIDKAVKYIDDLRDESAERQGFYNCFPDDLYIPDINDLLDILKEVSK